MILKRPRGTRIADWSRSTQKIPNTLGAGRKPFRSRSGNASRKKEEEL